MTDDDTYDQQEAAVLAVGRELNRETVAHEFDVDTGDPQDILLETNTLGASVLTAGLQEIVRDLNDPVVLYEALRIYLMIRKQVEGLDDYSPGEEDRRRGSM